MLTAVVTFTFDPFLRIGDRSIPLESIGIAAAILLGLLLAASLIRRVGRRAGEPDAPVVDLLLLAVAAVPGAVVGGRLGNLLLHADWYRAHPAAIVDPSQAGFELSLAVVGGTLTALLLATSIRAPIALWLQVAALPLLVTLGLAKLATALGGTGQGAPWWGLLATSYGGDGPWASLDPSGAAWPAQLLEGLLTLLAAALVALAIAPGSEPKEREGSAGVRAPHPLGPTIPDGRAFLLALWAWAAIRLLVAFTWRDSPVLGPLRAESLIALGLAAAAAFGYVVRANRAGRGGAGARSRGTTGSLPSVG